MFRVFESKKSQIPLDDGKRVQAIVISLQLQPIVSLAEKFDLSVDEMAKKLSAFFRSQGADFVFDLKAAEDISVLEQQKEFVQRFRECVDDKTIRNKRLPILTSACPGWVCYAEKSHGNWILPFISRVKSAQQIMGSFVKEKLSAKMNVAPETICHVTLMPCFDKKLEASRPDFTNQTTGDRDVDLVVTAVEIEQMLTEQNVDLASISEFPLDNISLDENRDNSDPKLYRNIGSGSGGYSESVFIHAAKEIFGENISEVQYTTVKNSDFLETKLERNGETLLHFAIANGFRNIQNTVQKMKRKRCQYDFVEIMACPSGCLNGGAQVKTDPKEISSKDSVAKLEKTFQTLECKLPEDNSEVKVMYSDWLAGKDSDKAEHLLYTDYHEVQKDTNSLVIKW